MLSDQVAVPSTFRSGARCAVATIRARAAASYVGRRPRPAAISSAASPTPLNRRTRYVTACGLRYPAARAAAENACPPATASSAVARFTRSTRSLLALTIVFNSRCSAIVNGRNRSFCMVAMMPCSYHAVSRPFANLSELQRDPLVG